MIARIRLGLLLSMLLASPAIGQNSTFDTDNEGWGADGDVTTPIAPWQATGGNPGGYIRVTDASTGGTWHFVAPAKFLGIKCDAYGHFLRYDQFVSNNSNPNNTPDVSIEGAGGLRLVFNNPTLPGLTWTHFDILLRENAGWRLNTLNGPVPTVAQFKQVLSNVTSLRIRGEYFSFADDFGGLDNVVLESDFFFEFDLDGDDSSGASNGDFLADTSCIPFSLIADMDAQLMTGEKIDSLVVRVLFPGPNDALELDAIPGALDVQSLSLHQITLINGGTATAQDFVLALQLMHYNDLSLHPVRGERIVEIIAYTDCGAVAIRRAYLPIYPTPNAGEDGDTLVCAGSAAFDLFELLGGIPETGGIWAPPPTGPGGSFDPSKDATGVYAYLFSNAGKCPGDTAYITVEVEQPSQLRPDTTMCHGDTLTLQIPPNLLTWTWSDGSHRVELIVTSPDTYTLTGQTEHCLFSDSVQVNFYTCEPCIFYAPNVFSPNDDGVNDGWHIFLPCPWQQFRLEIYDRWGSLVFAANDPETEWDGTVRGSEPAPGVYVWIVEWTGELFGAPKVYRGEGDLTVVR